MIQAARPEPVEGNEHLNPFEKNVRSLRQAQREREFPVNEIVQIVPYNPQWPDWYRQEASSIKTLFNQSRLVAIEHYGSTAVPGLAAKPTIGILVGLSSLPHTEQEQRILAGAGYQLYKQLEGRTYWRKCAAHTFTLAITIFESETWFDHLAVRDYLIKHPEATRSYAAVKYEAIKQGKITAESYWQYKKPFLDELFKHAKQWHCAIIKK